MWNSLFYFVAAILLPVSVSVSPVAAGVQLYKGTMEVVAASGKACKGIQKSHDLVLVINDDQPDDIRGYFEGSDVVAGKFAGSDLAKMEVVYPDQDARKATGHYISLVRSGNALTGELHDRVIDAEADGCNFNLGRLSLQHEDNEAAQASLKKMAGLYDAEIIRSKAAALALKGRWEDAAPLYEEALALADLVSERDAVRLNRFISGLASCYVRLGRSQDFNSLYDRRFASITDESTKTIFTGFRVNSLIQQGRTLLSREEYDAALDSFMQAYKLLPQNKDLISATMTVYIRSGRYAEAVAFLEKAADKLESESDRRDIHGIIALVYYKKALKDDKDNKKTEAEASLRKAISLDPGSVQYLAALARIRHKAGSFDEAENLLKQGLSKVKDEASRKELMAALEKMRQTEHILSRIR